MLNLLAFALPQAFAQQQVQTTPEVLIKGFLYAVYQTNQSPLEIAKKYISLEPGPNELSVDRRYQGIAEHIADIRSKAVAPHDNLEKPILFNSISGVILPYQEAKNRADIPIRLTPEQQNLTYVLVEDGKPRQYFAVRKGKIISFFLFQKGTDGPSYFLCY
jgi:hypothetical protein